MTHENIHKQEKRQTENGSLDESVDTSLTLQVTGIFHVELVCDHLHFLVQQERKKGRMEDQETEKAK